MLVFQLFRYQTKQQLKRISQVFCGAFRHEALKLQEGDRRKRVCTHRFASSGEWRRPRPRMRRRPRGASGAPRRLLLLNPKLRPTFRFRFRLRRSTPKPAPLGRSRRVVQIRLRGLALLCRARSAETAPTGQGQSVCGDCAVLLVDLCFCIVWSLLELLNLAESRDHIATPLRFFPEFH